MPHTYIKRILQAQVYDVAVETALEPAQSLSRRLQNRILLKREDLQPVFSFKIRGAYNKIAKLDGEQQQRGVITASAGNHAQGVALSAAQMGITAVIVMPKTTPEIKVTSVQALGGEVVLHGDNFDEAFAHACELERQHGYAFVHPYDDPDVIAGQGTVGMEIMRQISGSLDAIFIPVGGGGLLAGVSCYIKYLRPEVKIIAVEADDSACLKAALEAGERVRLDQVGLFADGVAVKQIGEETFRLARKHVDEVITVTADEICAAIKDVFDDTRSICEPAGALSVAGLKAYVEREHCQQQSLLAITSGANVNFDRLRHIAERSELGERREAIFAVTIPERPGSFLQFCNSLGRHNITEFNYRYASEHDARVFVGIRTGGAGLQQATEIKAGLEGKGYEVVDLSDNEMAKVHIRYMVGGHGVTENLQSIPDEMLYRFEFPERPGALAEFLMKLGAKWNISLFHYRNHGAAYGRVVLGLQVPENDRGLLMQYFEELDYQYWDESENPAYALFLK